MKFKNPVEFQFWNTVQAYKLEAANPQYNFTEEQKNELIKLTDIAEKYHNTIHIGKMTKALIEFDKIFVDFGGNLDNLSDKVDDIFKGSRFAKAGDKIMNTPGLLKKGVKMLKHGVRR